MKKRIQLCSNWLLLVMLTFVLLPTVWAQGTLETIPDDMMRTPFKDWQLNLTTIFVAAKILGEFFTGVRARGGIVGGIRGVLFGENVPKPISQDYKEELKPQKQNQ